MPEPITDDDRLAHEWRESVEQNPNLAGDKAHAAARAIRAHVPAPPETIADELRKWGKHPAAFMVSTELLALADRVETIEKHNDEVVGIVADLTEQRDEARDEIESVGRALDCGPEQRLVDVATRFRAEVDRLAKERDHARDCLEKEVQDRYAPGGVIPQGTFSTENLDRMNLPDPADVPEGEAWLVEDSGRQFVGVRNRPCTDHFQWHLLYLDAVGGTRRSDHHITLISRLVPDTRRTVTTADELDALPRDSIVIDKVRDAWQRHPGAWGSANGGLGSRPARDLLNERGPLTVVYTPEEA